MNSAARTQGVRSLRLTGPCRKSTDNRTLTERSQRQSGLFPKAVRNAELS
jgi:hypothetical protein